MIEEILCNQPVASRAQRKKKTKDTGIYPHAAMTFSDVSSDRQATYASSDRASATETTDAPPSDSHSEDLEDLDDEVVRPLVDGGGELEDEFIVGPLVGPVMEESELEKAGIRTTVTTRRSQ